MSHHGWTPLNVTGPHFVERILSMNSRRSQTDVQKNPSLMRERSCSFRSFGLQCTVQYRTAMFSVHTMRQSWTAVFADQVPTFRFHWKRRTPSEFVDKPPRNPNAISNLTGCARPSRAVRKVIISTYDLASVGENHFCRFCDLSCADFPRTNSMWSHLTCEWRQLLCFLHVFWHVEIIFFTTILDTFSV